MPEELVATIGLETHVQLNTQTKIWCGCSTTFGQEPNTAVCPVCLGYPGSLPVLNGEAIRKTIIAGLLLNCEINLRNKHDRKSYFYPDMPKNYQITQYDQPICIGGRVDYQIEGVAGHVDLTRIHLEEDVGKNTHLAGSSGVDYNRAGTPLMEIVTEPCMHNADEAFAYVQALRRILLYSGVTNGNLEQGNIRCDINCSVAPAGATELGVKTEIKNMNTLKGLHRALSYEMKRQFKCVRDGTPIVQETRRWDDERGVTESMRSKEYAHDYRYLPDPDLMPIVITTEEVESIRAGLPELPADRRVRFVEAFGLPEYDAGLLVADKAVGDYFEATAAAAGDAKAASNWVMNEVLRVLGEGEQEIENFGVTPEQLGALVKLQSDKTVSSTAAKEIFAVLLERDGGDPKAIAEELGKVQTSDTGAIEVFVDQAIEANPGPADEFRSGKENALQFLVGQVMRFSKGQANPQMASEMLRKKLGE